uniref:DUF4203 domain-containing protein n=1 Tax=Glossina brevipalpis TaxID=37001 RepID=A0A1A9X1G8_9MUSC
MHLISLMLLFGILFIQTDLWIANSEMLGKPTVHFMQPDSVLKHTPSKRGIINRGIQIYCYRGATKSLSHLLESIIFQLNVEGDDYTQYGGSTPAEVQKLYDDNHSFFSIKFFSQRGSSQSLSPFTQHCFGVDTNHPYDVHLTQAKVDYRRFFLLLGGMSMFFFAGILSSNAIFYYIFGTIIGVFASFLLIVWISGKLFPKRTMMFGILTGGWAMGFYLLHLIWDNIRIILLTYAQYFTSYVLITGFISFLFCYRHGPPTNERSKKIVKWLIQIVSLASMYLSSQYKEAIVVIMIGAILANYLPLKKFLPQQNNNKHVLLESDNKILKPLESNNNFDTDTDSSFSEYELNTQKLYPLPNGSYILSKDCPIAFTSNPGNNMENSQKLENDESRTTNYTSLKPKKKSLKTSVSISGLLTSDKPVHPKESLLQQEVRVSNYQKR